MIEQIRLEKKHFGNLEDNEHDIPFWFYRIIITPNWISNSHWAVKKNLITNADDFKSEETIRKYFQISEDEEFTFLEFGDEKVELLFPETREKHIKTNEIKTRQKDYIQFKDYDNDHEVYFDPEYIELFKITKLWGSEKGVYVNIGKGGKGDPVFLIMPCNL